MHLDLDDGGISRALYWVEEREQAFMGILEETVQPGMVCLDIGANIGYATLFMLRRSGHDGFVYAVEPDPHNVELLRDNVRANRFQDRCEIIQGAISSEDGDMALWLADQPNLHSVIQTSHSRRSICVPALSLETFIETHRVPAFVKMDVEGHEVQILGGATDHFRKNSVPVAFLIEVHPYFYGPTNDFASVLESYLSFGFKARYVVSTPVAEPRLFREAGYRPVRVLHTDNVERGIYEHVTGDDLIRFACRENEEGDARKIVRSFLLCRD